MNPSTRRTDSTQDVVVLGAGPIGLTTALLLARAGHRVLVLDRDPQPVPDDSESAWRDWNRPGVNQFRQPHIALPRWHQEMQRELPEVTAALRARGAVPVNLLHLHPDASTGGPQAGDDRFDTLTARRPVLEAAIAQVAATEPGVTVRRGCRVTGLVPGSGAGRTARVAGVCVDSQSVAADLVVDAGGHRTPVPNWLAEAGAGPVVRRAESGLVYYTRHYAAPGGAPIGTRGALTQHHSYAVLSLPADHDCWGLAIVVNADDRPTRGLRDEQAWERALRTTGLDERWLRGAPLTGIRPMAGLHDIVRDYAPDGAAVVEGLVPVGDAWATTSPFLGRGLTLGVLQAIALRDAVAAGREGAEVRYAHLLAERVLPYVQATITFGRHRVAQMAAEAAGRDYRTDDPAWTASTALATGARHDPVLLRAQSAVASLLAMPAEVCSAPEVGPRLGPWFGTAAGPPDAAQRIALLGAIGAVRASTTPTRQGAMT